MLKAVIYFCSVIKVATNNRVKTIKLIKTTSKMSERSVFMFPDKGNGSSIDPALLLAMNNNGGFGNGAMWMWPMFMWMMYPWLFSGMNGGFGGFGGFGGGAGNVLGTGFLSNQINESQAVNSILQAVNGRADAASQLAQLTHGDVNQVQNILSTIQTSLATVAGNVGLSAQEVISQILSGNAALSQQLCKCCCDNQLAICQQTNTLQSQAAANHAESILQRAQNFAAQQLQTSQNHAEDRLDVCQQTNELKTQAINDTQSIKDAIAAQSIMINEKFCDLEKRELQDKINTQSDIITQLRGQLDNDRQTAQLFAAINPLQAKVNEIANKQPNTVPVQWPNLIAANATPYVGQNYGYPGYYNGNGFGGSIVF